MKRVMENGLTVCGKRKWETILILLFIMSCVIDTEKSGSDEHHLY